MIGLASFIVGFAWTIAIAAVGHLFTLYFGGVGSNVALAWLIPAQLAVLLPEREGTSIRRRTVSYLALVAAVFVLLPYGMEKLLADQIAADAGRRLAYTFLFLAPAGFLISLAGQSILAWPATANAPYRRGTLLLLGAALGPLVTPYLVFDALGFLGAIQFSAALFGVAAAVAAAAPFLSPEGLDTLSAAPPLTTPDSASLPTEGLLTRLPVAAVVGLAIGLFLRGYLDRLDGTLPAIAPLLGLMLFGAAAGTSIARSIPRQGFAAGLPFLGAGLLLLANASTLMLAFPDAELNKRLGVSPAETAWLFVFVAISVAAVLNAPPRHRDLPAAALVRSRSRIWILCATTIGIGITTIEHGRYSPDAATTFAGSLGLLLGVIGALIGAASHRSPRAIAHALIGQLLFLLTLGLAIFGRADSTPANVRHVAWEADCTRTIAIRDDRREWHIAQDGTRLETQLTDSRAARRLLLIALALRDAPLRSLVLGPCGDTLAASLLDLQSADVTWVTPFFGDAVAAPSPPRLHTIVEAERRFIATTEERFDLVVITPPVAPTRRRGLVLTSEFLQEIRDHLAPDGILLVLEPIGHHSAQSLQQEILVPMVAACDELLLFVDHPRSTLPILGLVSAPTPVSLGPDALQARLDELSHSDVAREVMENADLDVRGLLQCYLMDHNILRLYLRNGRPNRDHHPWLAAAREPSLSRRQPGALQWLTDRRSTSRARMGMDAKPLDPASSPITFSLSGKIRYDFQATGRLLTGTLGAMNTRRAYRDPEDAAHPADDLDPLLNGVRQSPYFGFARGPLDRAINDRIRRRRLEEAEAIALALAHADPSRNDLMALVARLKLRRGLYEDASNILERLLRSNPDDARLNLDLGLLLAGEGPTTRKRATPHLQASIASGTLAPGNLLRAKTALSFVQNDHQETRTLLEDEKMRGNQETLFVYIREYLSTRDPRDP